MKTLKFKESIRFQVNSVVQFTQVWHLVGNYLVGKFRMERRIRVEPDPRWLSAKIIELPGNELREVESACGHMGRRQAYRPVYTGKIYVMPALPPDTHTFRASEFPSAFKFDEIKILGALKHPRRSEPQGSPDYVRSEDRLAVADEEVEDILTR